MAGIGIYVFSYRADAFAVDYSLGDAVEFLYQSLRLDGLLNLSKLILYVIAWAGLLRGGSWLPAKRH